MFTDIEFINQAVKQQQRAEDDRRKEARYKYRLRGQ